MDIISAIGVGKENAVTRTQLCEKLGRGDRAVRQMIEDARCQGALIINDQDGRGYFIATKPSEVLEQYRSNQARALSILRQNARLAKGMAELDAAQDRIAEVVLDG